MKLIKSIIIVFSLTCISSSLWAQQSNKEAEGRRFILDEKIGWEELEPGIKRKIMSYDATMMMVKIDFKKGGVGKEHKHVHTQMSYVESGVFEVTVDGKKQILKKGDAFYVPSNVMHGAVCLKSGVLIDMFTPMREDFVK